MTSSRSWNLLLALTTVALTAVTGCAHFDDQLKERLDPWLTRTPDQLVELWGAPSSTYAMDSGTKVLSYFNDRTYSRTSGFGYSAWRYNSYSYTDSCKINFFTDTTQKKIERYTTTGDRGSCLESLRELPKP